MYADSELYTCSPRIGSDPEKNVIEFDFTVSDSMPDAQFVVALYIENKLDKINFFTVSEVREIIEYNLEATEKTKKYVSVEHEQTPDSIKVFAWKDTLIPVCEEKNLFSSADDYIAANEIISSQLEIAVTALDELYRLYFIYDEEKAISEILITLGNDALTKKDSLLLTREFAQRYYYDSLSEVKSIYSTMDKTMKNEFQNRILDHTDLSSLAYIIDYLGLKEIMFS